jgi:hypothetical protein
MDQKSFRWEDLYTSKFILCITISLLFSMHVSYANTNTEANLFIQYQKSLLSVNIQGAKLSDVIRELRDKTGVIFNYKSLPDQTVYLFFSNLSLKDGIKQAIPYGTIFVSDQTSNGVETIKSVYILSSLGLTETKLQKEAPTDISPPITSLKKTSQSGIEHLAWQAKDAAMAYQWLIQLQNKDPEKRLEAIRKLGKLSSNFFSVKGLYLALNDSDRIVRKLASENLKTLDENNRFKSLSEELEQKDYIIQKHALDVIKLQKGSRWVDLLSQSIKSKQIDTSLRENAEEILVHLQSK